MYKCKHCKRTFNKPRVFNQHLSISHKAEWIKTIKKWKQMHDAGTPAREIAEKYDVNILTVYKYFKRIEKGKIK